jgi:adenine deaminase
MINRFTVAPLNTMTRTLAAVAMGRQPPDYVITGARILSTYSERMLEEREIWIKWGRIAAVKPAGSYPLLPGDHTIRYDARGGIIAPGLVDPQVNLPSSMMSACAYAETALLNGTTTIVCDCQEIVASCGERGLNWFIADARRASLSIFIKVPAQIFATDSVNTDTKIAQIFEDWPEAIAIGGRIDFSKLPADDIHVHGALLEALKRNRPLTGSISHPDFVAANAAFGMTDTDDAGNSDMADDCLEAGMWLLLRGGSPGSPWHNLPQAVKAMTELGANSKRICVCTDERDAQDLVHFGLDWVVRQTVAAGVNPIAAWSMGSLHPASRYAMDNEIGGLGHSRRADIVLLNDDLEVQNTWYGGQLVVENKQITPAMDKALSKRYEYPQAAYRTIKLPRRLKLAPDLPTAPVIANVIGVDASNNIQELREVELRVTRNWTELLVHHQLCFVAVVRRGGTGSASEVGHALLQGSGLVDGAIASSHGGPNLVVIGSNEGDMKLALTTVKELDGGVCVVRHGIVLASVPLPIGGVMSDQRAPDIVRQLERLKLVWTELGCTMPFMSFSRLSSGAFSEIRLSDSGLVLASEQRPVSLFEPITDATAS